MRLMIYFVMFYVLTPSSYHTTSGDRPPHGFLGVIFLGGLRPPRTPPGPLRGAKITIITKLFLEIVEIWWILMTIWWNLMKIKDCWIKFYENIWFLMIFLILKQTTMKFIKNPLNIFIVLSLIFVDFLLIFVKVS